MLTVAIFFGKKLLEKSKFVLQFHMNPQEQVSYSKWRWCINPLNLA
jgi:hypothetical protein